MSLHPGPVDWQIHKYSHPAHNLLRGDVTEESTTNNNNNKFVDITPVWLQCSLFSQQNILFHSDTPLNALLQVQVVDVVSRDGCVCQTAERKLLEGKYCSYKSMVTIYLWCAAQFPPFSCKKDLETLLGWEITAVNISLTSVLSTQVYHSPCWRQLSLKQKMHASELCEGSTKARSAEICDL